MFEYFRKRAREKALKAARKISGERKLEAHNFGTAKTIGVLFCFKFEVENKAIQHLKRIIRDNRLEYKILTYYPQKELPENIISDPSNIYFSDKNCTKYGKPGGPDINTFINEGFDMLIDLNATPDCYITHYIATASKAKFKIGRLCYEDDPYDFTLTGHEDDDKFVTELEKYLPKFK